MKAEYFTPVITVFDPDGKIDQIGNNQIYDHLIRVGIDGILVLGSAGEFFGMTLEQRRELARFALSRIAGRKKVLIGTGCMSLDETIMLSNEALDLGADGVMVVGPFYINLSAASIIDYYDRLAERVHGQIYLYNYPDRTGYDLSPEITLTLLRRHKNIVGYKDTVPSMSHTRELIDTVKPEFPDFAVFCGYDENFAHNILAGGAGCIGALSNLVPEICAAWVSGFRDNDLAKVAEIQQQINRLMHLYTIGSPFMPIMKAALNLRGFCISTGCTSPIQTPTDRQVADVRHLLDETGLLSS